MQQLNYIFDALKKQERIFFSIVLLFLGINFLSCKKEGLGGKANVQGKVLHHETPIPGATVLIKYGAKEMPGTNPTDYDQSVTASLVDATYKFENLRAGKYFIYSIGFDSTIMEAVKGGIPVTIKSKKETLNKDVPVTE